MDILALFRAKAQDFYSKRDWRAFPAQCSALIVAVILC
jgi:hypothetical protein